MTRTEEAVRVVTIDYTGQRTFTQRLGLRGPETNSAVAGSAVDPLEVVVRNRSLAGAVELDLAQFAPTEVAVRLTGLSLGPGAVAPFEVIVVVVSRSEATRTEEELSLVHVEKPVRCRLVAAVLTLLPTEGFR